MMLYTENEITCDFDKLSLLTEGTPKERITGYNVTLSPRKQCVFSLPSSSGKVGDSFEYDRCKPLPAYGDESFLSKNPHAALCVMGKGRGKITDSRREVIDQYELDLQREKELRLTNPLGYSNELIEYHNAAIHHQKENLPQALALPAENLAPISSNNVALSSLSKKSKKRGKTSSDANGLVMNDVNFPKLK